MKKIIGLICGLLCISAIASAQHVSAGVRIENVPGYYADIYGPHCLEHSTSLHTWGLSFMEGTTLRLRIS